MWHGTTKHVAWNNKTCGMEQQTAQHCFYTCTTMTPPAWAQKERFVVSINKYTEKKCPARQKNLRRQCPLLTLTKQ